MDCVRSLIIHVTLRANSFLFENQIPKECVTNLSYVIRPCVDGKSYSKRLRDKFVTRCVTKATLVLEVFLDFSPHERTTREPRRGEDDSRGGEKEKPLLLKILFLRSSTLKWRYRLSSSIHRPASSKVHGLGFSTCP